MELKAARYKIGVETNGDQSIQAKGQLKIVDRLISTMDKWITKEPSTASQVKKKFRDEQIGELIKQNMVDSTTDMELTPSWWDSEETRAKQDGSVTSLAERCNRRYPHTDADTDMEIDQNYRIAQRTRNGPTKKKTNNGEHTKRSGRTDIPTKRNNG